MKISLFCAVASAPFFPSTPHTHARTQEQDQEEEPFDRPVFSFFLPSLSTPLFLKHTHTVSQFSQVSQGSHSVRQFVRLLVIFLSNVTLALGSSALGPPSRRRSPRRIVFLLHFDSTSHPHPIDPDHQSPQTPSSASPTVQAGGFATNSVHSRRRFLPQSWSQSNHPSPTRRYPDAQQ